MFFGGCELNHSAASSDYSVNNQPTVEPTTKINSETTQAKADGKSSFECVRPEPEPIIKKEVFPDTTFRLEKNKEFPFQHLGYETVEFKNGDKLLIENVGCENFTLILHFEVAGFPDKMDDTRFWYKKSADLIAQANKGINDIYLINGGLKALNSYIKKNKQLEFKKEIDFGGSEIKYVVSLDEVEKLKDNRVEITVSFGAGAL